MASASVYEPRIPFLLRAVAKHSGGIMAAPPEENDFDERFKVLGHLLSKFLKLDDAGAALQLALRDHEDNPAKYDKAALKLAKVRAEQSLCKAQHDVIAAGQPFSDPGPAAEQALLDAILDVDRARANTAAIDALINAAHALVQAYPAKDTRAAAKA